MGNKILLDKLFYYEANSESNAHLHITKRKMKESMILFKWEQYIYSLFNVVTAIFETSVVSWHQFVYTLLIKFPPKKPVNAFLSHNDFEMFFWQETLEFSE